MITVIYDLIKDKIPNVIAVKMRTNDDFLIVQSTDLEIYYLNETAKIFLLMCDGIKNIECLTQKLFDIYEVEENTVKTDVVDLIRDLQWKKILSLR